MKSNEIEISNAKATHNRSVLRCSVLHCKEDGTKMQYITNKHDIYFWWCPVCDAMILESAAEFSLCYLTPGEWK